MAVPGDPLYQSVSRCMQKPGRNAERTSASRHHPNDFQTNERD